MFKAHDEIFKQSESLLMTFELVLGKKKQIARFFGEHATGDIVFLACGSSYMLSLSASMLFTSKTGIKSYAVQSGDVIMHKEFYGKLYNNPLVIAPTRSGSTSETLEAIKFFKQIYGSKVLAIVEYPNAPIAVLSDFLLEIPWCNEDSVCQTRSFSNLYMVSVLLACAVLNNTSFEAEIAQYLEMFPQLSLSVFNKTGNIVKSLNHWGKGIITLGNGFLSGVANESSYLFLEMVQFPAFFYGTLEFRHGPIVLLNEGYTVFVFSYKEQQKFDQAIVADIKKKGAKVCVITNCQDFEGADFSFVYNKNCSAEMLGLFGTFVMQAFAYQKAVDMGINPDAPKDLTPWIKLENPS